MIFQTDTGDERISDLVSVIIRVATHIYGRWQDKRHAEEMKQCVESMMQLEKEE